MRIYVSSSTRNDHRPEVVARLRGLGHQVYDFREHRFSWEEVAPDWESWTADDYRRAVDLHDAPGEAIGNNLEALARAHAVVMVMPCGPGVHLELGWVMGRGKLGAIYVPDEERDGQVLDLMHIMGDIAIGWEELVMWTEIHLGCPLCDEHLDSEVEVEDHVSQMPAGPGRRAMEDYVTKDEACWLNADAI